MTDDKAAEALAKIIWDAGLAKMSSDEIATAILAAIRAGQVPGVEAGGWRPIEEAPKDGTEFLSCGDSQTVRTQAMPTRWLSPGPYTTENGKNTPGQRRYQWPDGFYWAGYDGFVGPVNPRRFRPLPAPPEAE